MLPVARGHGRHAAREPNTFLSQGEERPPLTCLSAIFSVTGLIPFHLFCCQQRREGQEKAPAQGHAAFSPLAGPRARPAGCCSAPARLRDVQAAKGSRQAERLHAGREASSLEREPLPLSALLSFLGAPGQLRTRLTAPQLSECWPERPFWGLSVGAAPTISGWAAAVPEGRVSSLALQDFCGKMELPRSVESRRDYISTTLPRLISEKLERIVEKGCQNGIVGLCELVAHAWAGKPRC